MVWMIILGWQLQWCYGSPPTGRMEVVAKWKDVELQFPSPAARNAAIASGSYVPKNMSVWSILIHLHRMFLFCPNQLKGTYSTVNFVFMNELNMTEPPKLIPYPPCLNNNITSVFRADLTCHDNYMYFVDDGIECFGGSRSRRHPPRLCRVDLLCDHLEILYSLCPADYTNGSLFTNLVVDQCTSGMGVNVVYLCDLAQYAIVVVDLKKNTSHRVRHPYFIMDPFSAFLDAGGWGYTFMSDGIGAVALTEPLPRSCNRTLYFASSGGRHVFSVTTETLRNQTLSSDTSRYRVVGFKGNRSQSNNMVYDPDSKLLLYATTQENTLYCWNTTAELTPESQCPVMTDDALFRVPNDLHVDCDGNLWALSNNWVERLVRRRNTTGIPTGCSSRDVNFVVLRSSLRDLSKVCTARHTKKPTLSENFNFLNIFF